MLSLVLSIFLFTYPLMWKTLKLDQINLSYVYLVIFLPAAILIYPMIRHLEKIDKINLAIKAGWFFLLIGFLSFISLIFNEFSSILRPGFQVLFIQVSRIINQFNLFSDPELNPFAFLEIIKLQITIRSIYLSHFDICDQGETLMIFLLFLQYWWTKKSF